MFTKGLFLSEQASQAGHETESWTIDSAQAPRERDWVGAQSKVAADLYFYTKEFALAAQGSLKRIEDLEVGSVDEQKAEDWDAQWKASFTGADVEPFWRVVPPWQELSQATASEKFLSH